MIALLGATAACGTTTQFAATNPSPRALHARPAEQVAVFATGVPQIPFVEVGVIQANQTSGFSHAQMPDLVAAMRRAAGARGCDGLVVNGPRDQARGSAIAHDAATASVTLEGFWGTCIVFVDPVPEVAHR